MSTDYLLIVQINLNEDITTSVCEHSALSNHTIWSALSLPQNSMMPGAVTQVLDLSASQSIFAGCVSHLVKNI
jgi:hypothetical protein